MSSPPNDTGELIPAWSCLGYGEATYVAGIGRHHEDFLRMVRAVGAGKERPSMFGGTYGRADVLAVLAPEPGNPHDPNAVRVTVAGQVIGYLGRDIAPGYAAVLGPLAQHRRYVCVPGVVAWGNGREGTEEWVRLQLPQPHLLFPRNDPPAPPYAKLPPTHRVKVPGNADLNADLAGLVARTREVPIYATLHPIIATQPGSTAKPLVEVRIDGQPVGRLTPAGSAHVLGVAARAGELGVTLAVDALARGNSIEAEVTVWLAHTTELPQDWLSELERAAAGRAEPAAEQQTTAPVPAEVESLPAADWYPDPNNATQYRYWDGTAWTEHIAPR
jgi:hypothetical protein